MKRSNTIRGVASTLEVLNFQSHVSSRLELSPGVNVVTGSSDSGKSTLVRALVWLVKNRPQGFTFKSNFAKGRDATLVRLQFSDGACVERERSNSQNRYLISGGSELEALRADVPSEVKALLALEDYNIQGQHDGYFLLQSSSGEVARLLNEVVGLDVIDITLKNVNSIVTCARQDAERFRMEADKVEETLEDYRFISQAEVLVCEVGELIKRRDAALSREYQLQRLLAEYESEQEKLIGEGLLAKAEGKLSAVQNAVKSARLDERVQRLEVMESVLSQYEFAELTEQELRRHVVGLEEEQERILKQIDRCPACGSVVDDEGRERLIGFFDKLGDGR